MERGVALGRLEIGVVDDTIAIFHFSTYCLGSVLLRGSVELGRSECRIAGADTRTPAAAVPRRSPARLLVFVASHSRTFANIPLYNVRRVAVGFV